MGEEANICKTIIQSRLCIMYKAKKKNIVVPLTRLSLIFLAENPDPNFFFFDGISHCVSTSNKFAFPFIDESEPRFESKNTVFSVSVQFKKITCKMQSFEGLKNLVTAVFRRVQIANQNR